MKTLFGRLARFVKVYKTYTIITAVVLLGGFFIFSGGDDTKASEGVATITQGELEEVVSVTGRVVPAQNVILSFERGGVVGRVYATVGQFVSRGDLLASLSNGNERGRLLEAKAGYDAALATLEQLKRGARAEEIAIEETSVNQSKRDLENMYLNVPDVLRGAYTNANDAVRVKLSGIFDGRGGTGYRLTFIACDAQADIDATNLRGQAEGALLTVQKNSYDLAGASIDTIDAGLTASYNALLVVSRLIDRTNDLLTVPCSLSNSSLDTYRTQAVAAKTAINVALSDVSLKRNTIASQKLTLKRAEENLTLTKAGTESEKIKVQEAAVAQALARVTQAEADVSQTIIVAPFSGKITTVEAKVGQYASPSVSQVALITDTAFEIEAKIPEVDIAKIQLNNAAAVTLDAYGQDELFSAIVSKIDPAETIEDGVPTYMTTLLFVGEDSRIRSGMTANIEITTLKKNDVFSVPARALRINEEGERYITVVLDKETTKDIFVRIGMRGKNGSVEIISDEIEAGMSVQTSTPEK